MMVDVPPLIEAESPRRWQDLEACVARILRECGYQVETQRNVRLARGEAKVDVYAVDDTSPPNIFAFECKHWKTPATRGVVQAFRTVVGDSGANTGFIVSSAGFQRGAIEAAAYSNVRLLDWAAFQQMFVQKWFMNHMAPVVEDEGAELVEYIVVEPSSRIVRQAASLPADRAEELASLREKYRRLALTYIVWRVVPMARLKGRSWLRSSQGWRNANIPDLPLRDAEWLGDEEWAADLPDDVLDAQALRPLMDALNGHHRRALAEFEGIIGERA